MAEERQAVQTPQRVPRRNPLVEAVEHHLPGYRPEVVFDVGANVGADGDRVRARLSAGDRLCVRAGRGNVPDACRKRRGGDAHPAVQPRAWQARRARAHAHPALSVSNRIATWRDYYRPHETVTMASGDAFCAEHSIEQIGFLKIDAEGHDLEVLRGFTAMLKASRVDLVEAEVGMNPENRMHASFGSVQKFLERLGYRLFLLYDFGRDAPFTGRVVLRRCNAVFASPKLVETRRA